MVRHDAVDGVRRYEIDRRSTMFGLVTSAIFHLLIIELPYLGGDYIPVTAAAFHQNNGNDVWLRFPSELPEDNLNSNHKHAKSISQPLAKIGIPISIPQVESLLLNTVEPWFTKSGNLPANSNHVGGGGMSGNDESSTIGIGSIEIDGEPPIFDPGVEIYPEPISKVAPEYPDLARRANIEGKVQVRMLISKEGKVKKVSLVLSSNEVFNAAVTIAAFQWIFKPGMSGSGPVAVWVSVPFEFKLNK